MILIPYLISLFYSQITYAPTKAAQITLNSEQEAQAQAIGRDIRCAVCQGMSIADSPSSTAQSMMDRVREMVQAHQSEVEIQHYFIERYGEWIILTPKKTGLNWIVWLLPAFFAMGGVFIIYRFMRQQTNN